MPDLRIVADQRRFATFQPLAGHERLKSGPLFLTHFSEKGKTAFRVQSQNRFMVERRSRDSELGAGCRALAQPGGRNGGGDRAAGRVRRAVLLRPSYPLSGPAWFALASSVPSSQWSRLVCGVGLDWRGRPHATVRAPMCRIDTPALPTVGRPRDGPAGVSRSRVGCSARASRSALILMFLFDLGCDARISVQEVLIVDNERHRHR